MDDILTSLLEGTDAKTPVVTRSDSPNLSVCSVNFLTSDILAALVAPSSASSPLTEEAVETFLELAFDDSLEVAVFFLSPSAARLAWRAALDAETIFAR